MLKVIHDSDTREFLSDGDKLVLLVSPRRRDTLACETLEVEEALAALARLKAQGVDTEAVFADAQKDPEKVKAAREAASTAPDSPAVLAFKLKAVAVSLHVDGEKFGGEAIVSAYDSMDEASAAWVDAQVKTVWESAHPGDADTRRDGADARCADSAEGRPAAVHERHLPTSQGDTDAGAL